MGGLLLLVSITVFGAFVAACALDTQAQKIDWKRRAKLAALLGSFVPLAILTGIALLTVAELQALWVDAVLRVGLIAAILAVVVGYPVAYLLTRRFERSREPDIFK